MATAIAFVALIASAFAIHLGDFWFTYGIWPRSWGAFFLFFALTGINAVLLQAVTGGSKK